MIQSPTIPDSRQHSGMATIAANLRRLMARHGLTFGEVVEVTGLDERTIRGVVRGTNHPHARTLHKLAQGLNVEIDELFRPLGSSASRAFDTATNTFVEVVAAHYPQLFANWCEADFDEIYSRFGDNGQPTESDVLTAAQAINVQRELWHQISVILDSSEAGLLSEFVQLLHRRVTSHLNT